MKSDGARYEVRAIESDTSPIENPIESPINSDRVRWESPITQSDNESGPLCVQARRKLLRDKPPWPWKPRALRVWTKGGS